MQTVIRNIKLNMTTKRLLTPLLAMSFAMTANLGAANTVATAADTAAKDQASGWAGIRCKVGQNGYPVVEGVHSANKGAAAAKIKPGSELYQVNGEDTRYIGFMRLHTLLAGPTASTVHLKIKGNKAIDIKRVPMANNDVRTFELANWKVLDDNHMTDHVIDLPFSMLSQLHNKPTLFEFVEDNNEPGIEAKLKAHADGAYIAEHCRVVRIVKGEAQYEALFKALGLSGSYNLLPVYAPWLVTAKKIDLITSLPTDKQVDHIARILVHGAIRVQVAKSEPKAGLTHVSVWKRVFEVIPAGSGVAGVGFGVAPDGHPNITRIFNGGAADKAGLNPGDEITEVNGQDSRFLGLEKLQTALVGQTGTVVKLKVRKPDLNPETTKDVELTLTPIQSGEFANFPIAIWKKELSTDAFDTDEFELPCCMIGRANSKPTIFEFAEHDGPSVEQVLAGLRQWHIDDPAARVHDLHDLQVVRYTPADKDWTKLHEMLQIKTSYVALPVYLRTRHKTYKRGQILTGAPGTVEQALPLIAP
jgi:hypothetical protein